MNNRIKEWKADIQHEMTNLEKLLKEMEENPLDKNIMTRRAIGSILQDSYNCCERIFRMIAQEVNGVFPAGLDWHKQLLNKMTYGVEGVRPVVISEELASELEEYLSFRHLFRNIYGYELLSDRLERLKERAVPVFLRFITEIESFMRKIDQTP